MRNYLIQFILALLMPLSLAADAPPKLFTVPPMPPLGANKWSAAPIVVPLTLVTDAELPKNLPAPEPHMLDGQLPISDPKGNPMAVRREKDIGGNEIALGIDSSGKGDFFIKVPVGDKLGKVITFDIQRGSDPQTQRPKTDRYLLRIFSADGNWFYQRAGGLKGTLPNQPNLQGQSIFIADGNANGRFDDTGADLIAVGNGAPLPLAAALTLNNVLYQIKLDAGGGGPLTLTPVPYPETLARGIGHLNKWREQLGISTIKLHDELSRWAQCHADFLVKNNVSGLGEDPAMKLYTKEGAWSGAHSCVVAGPLDITAGVDEFTNSVFHRIMLLSPYLTVTGMGFTPPSPDLNGSMAETVIDISSTGDLGIEWLQPIACPADGQTGVASVWSGLETPGPLNFDPGADGVGFPVTLTFPSQKSAKNGGFSTRGGFEADMPRDVTCEIREDGAPAALEAFVSDPQHPAQPAVYADNLVTVAIVPKAPLKLDTIHVVTVNASWRGKQYKKVWRFATGNAQFKEPVKPDKDPIWKRVAPPPVPGR